MLAADPDGVDREAMPRGVARRIHRIACEIFTVAEQHEHLAMVRLAGHRLFRRADRGRDVGAAAWNGVRVERVEALEKHAAVDGHRRLHERIAGERDQPDAFAVELAHEVGDRELCASQAIRSQICGAHALGRVDREHQIEPVVRVLLEVIPDERPSHRKTGHREPGHGQRVA